MTRTLLSAKARFSLVLGASLLVSGLGAGAAHAATTAQVTAPPASGPLLASSRLPARARAASANTVSRITGLPASELSTVNACGAVSTGHATCMAQGIALSSTHRLVRPHVRRAPSFTQVFPRRRSAIRSADLAAPAAAPSGGTPAYLQQAYDLTYLSQTNGNNDTVAIVDAFDDPTAESDLTAYRSNFGLPACTAANGCFQKVNQNGQASPLPSPGWQDEISLDLDAVSALCPNCKILLVEANDNGLGNLTQAEQTAASMGANQISNSWGSGWSGSWNVTFTFPGVSTVASTGDNGYNNGFAAYPASLPGVTGAGGTALLATSSTSPTARGINEVAWGGAGSGCNVWEAKPSFQGDSMCPGRTYSDVSADAWPGSGLLILENGSWYLYGGTSLSSPLIAAYEAITGVDGTTPRWAYADSALLNDPASGSNGTCPGNSWYICNGQVGYDGPTGMGSISGDVTQGAPGVPTPSQGSGYAQSASTTGATLSGGVYANGLATTYYWEYGTTASYGTQTSTVTTSTPGLSTVTTNLSGLSPGTTYHLRLLASNADGTTYGYDSTFTTQTAPAAPPVATTKPTATGTAVQGQTLSATTGTWNPSGTQTDEWMRSTDGGKTWNAIPGASTTSYTLGTADVGNLVLFTVITTNSFGSAYASSSVFGPVTSAGPTATAHPTVSGTARQGQVLTGTTGTWTGGPTLSYQWEQSTDGGHTWLPIMGATNMTYTLGAGDAGTLVLFTVFATNSYGSTYSSSSPLGPVQSGAPVVIQPPSVTGPARQGQTLTAATGSWSGASSYAYEWMRSTDGGKTWNPISGATSTTYTPVSADVGNQILFTVLATNAYGTNWASSSVFTVLSGLPAATQNPVLSGTARQGQTLSATTGTWNPTGSYTYEWMRSTDGGKTWNPIPGATSTTYTLTSSDVGSQVLFTVLATNSFGTSWASTPPTSRVS